MEIRGRKEIGAARLRSGSRRPAKGDPMLPEATAVITTWLPVVGPVTPFPRRAIQYFRLQPTVRRVPGSVVLADRQDIAGRIIEPGHPVAARRRPNSAFVLSFEAVLLKFNAL